MESTMSEEVESNLLEMSDEAFMENADSLGVEEQEQVTDGTEYEEDGTQSTSEDDSSGTFEEYDEDADTDAEEQEQDDTESLDGVDESDVTEEESDEDEEGEVDYKHEYSKILAPFKANGKEIKVNSVDEAINLMQKGANYNKTMNELAPHKKTLKTLENNGLLDPSKINHLIDLANGDPKAVAKLLKDTKLDPLDIDTDDVDENYEPNEHAVSDVEMELDTVIEEISQTESYEETKATVTSWDGESRQVISENPQLIRFINEHIGNGAFAVIQDEVDRQKLLGGLQNLSNLDAYRTVGTKMEEDGKLAQFIEPPKKPSKKPAALDKALTAKRRAASLSGKKASTRKAPQENLLSMSDEDYMKQMGMS